MSCTAGSGDREIEGTSARLVPPPAPRFRPAHRPLYNVPLLRLPRASLREGLDDDSPSDSLDGLDFLPSPDSDECLTDVTDEDL